MYIVKTFNDWRETTIHGQRQKLLSGKVIQGGANTIDSFTFTIHPKNEGYYDLRELKTKVTVWNINKERYEFHGRVLTLQDEMDENGQIAKEVTCESFLGYLYDSAQIFVEEKTWTARELLKHFINTHNDYVEGEKKFTLGDVTVEAPEGFACEIGYKSTWEEIQEKLVKVLGGYIVLRVEGDVRYIDYLAEVGETKETKIALSDNMKSISREKDPTTLITRLIPLGAKRGESEERLTIANATNGLIYLDDQATIAQYGVRAGCVEFDDKTTASELKTAGLLWLAENNKVAIKYVATALDFSLIKKDYDDYEVFNSYPLENSLLGIDETLTVTKKGIDICEPTKSTMEFGDKLKTMTEIWIDQKTEMQHYLSNQDSTIKVLQKNQILAEDEIKGLNTALAALQQEYEQAKEENAGLKQQITDLQERIEDLEAQGGGDSGGGDNTGGDTGGDEEEEIIEGTEGLSYTLFEAGWQVSYTENVDSALTEILVANYLPNEEGQMLPVTSVAESGFANLTDKRIELPSTCNWISDSAFAGCTSLTVYIHAGCNYIGKDAFGGCVSWSIVYGGTYEEWEAITKDTDWNRGCGAGTLWTDGGATQYDIPACPA